MAAYVSSVVERLARARVRWPELQPACDHAIVLAKEAEHQAEWASNEVQAGISPAYPPLVLLLAESVEEKPVEVPF